MAGRCMVHIWAQRPAPLPCVQCVVRFARPRPIAPLLSRSSPRSEYMACVTYPASPLHASLQIRVSFNGNLGKRPAALCRLLGMCPKGLDCTVGAPAGLMDLCTSDGVQGGYEVLTDEEKQGPDGGCTSTADCGDTEVCQFEGRNKRVSAPAVCSA
jgi:hypothetical protein